MQGKALQVDFQGELKNSQADPSVLDIYEKTVFKPKKPVKDDKKQNEFHMELLNWATSLGVQHMTFICFPHNNSTCEKQDSLIDLRHYYDRAEKNMKVEAKLVLNNKLLQKTEADGSSFPSGGLRETHSARAYTLRDPHSQIFIRKSKKLMYVPSLLVAHNGEALDDKGIFRKAERIMKKSCDSLLTKLGKRPLNIVLNLGLEQEFFVVPKKAFENRPDLKSCGRALVGSIGAKSQQFSDHYYAKIPHQIQSILKDVEKEFLEIGIALKTKHNEVAPNQFEYAAVFCDAGKAIDQNMVAMKILEEHFDKNGFTVLFHEKPFQEINGSGKHANWSLGFTDSNGKVINLFAPPSEKDPKKKEEETKLFRLFILITLSALKNHNALYFGSIAPPGNEIRLGGHEAPPRIISAFLGSTVNKIVDGVEAPEPANLKDKLPFLLQDTYQEDTDRNRTSSFPYAGNRFEFRALGSTQNAAWPMAIICATLASEMKKVEAKLYEGKTIDEVINELLEDTRSVRFDGNGYNKAWADEAEKRGLYVNKSWSAILEKLHKEVQVFEDIGACSKSEIQGKVNCSKELYCKTVELEAKTLCNLSQQKIIPRAMKYLQTLNSINTESRKISQYAKKYVDLLENSLEELEKLEVLSDKCDSCEQACKVRAEIRIIGENLGKLCAMLEKDERFPDLDDFLVY